MNIHDAVSFGTLQDLIESLRSGEDPNRCDEHGFTPLRWASNRFDGVEMEKVTLLLEAGADPNAADRLGSTPMACAVTSGRMDLIELLQKYRASLRCESDCGSLVADAVLGRQVRLIPFLVREGADVNLISRDGFTPLMLAAGNGVPEAIPALLGAGAKLEIRDSNHGLTAYLHTAFVGDLASARILAEAGADLGAMSDDGKTAAMLAAENGHRWEEPEKK